MNIFQLLTTKREAMYLLEDMTLTDAMDKLRASGYTAVPVICEDGTYADTVSEGDFLWAFLDGKDTDEKGDPVPLKNIVRTDRNPSVKIDVDISQVFAEALNQNFVPVVDDRNMFIGIVTRKQVMSCILEKLKEFASIRNM